MEPIVCNKQNKIVRYKKRRYCTALKKVVLRITESDELNHDGKKSQHTIYHHVDDVDRFNERVPA